jgi:hypothetical protein
MADFSRTPADQPALEELARVDRFVDALAAREAVEFADPGDDVLAALLEEWRDELRWPPASALVSPDEAVAALNSGLAAARDRRRMLASIGSVAAAVLAFGGFGAMVGDARPGDPLYGIHTMLFGEPPSVHDEQIELSAKTELAKVQQMIAQGQWDQAQDRLAAVNDTVQTVNDTTRKQNLIDQVNQLNAKVATRDPNATVTPSSVPYPGGDAPSASATVSVPASEPPSTTPASSSADASTTPTTAMTDSMTATSTATSSSPTSVSATSTGTSPIASPAPSSATSPPVAGDAASGTATSQQTVPAG